MPDIATVTPHADLRALLNYAWNDEEMGYASTRGIERDVAFSHAHANVDNGHIFTKMVRVALWLEETQPADPVPSESAETTHAIHVNVVPGDLSA